MGETISIEAELANLKEVKSGDSIYTVNSAARWNSLRRLIIALASGQNIKKGANMLKKTGPTWCMLSAIEQASTQPSVEVCPIDILELDSTAYTVKFRPITVNQLVPSNFKTPLSLINTTNYIYVHCTTDGTQVNSATFEVSSTPRPPPAATMGSAPVSFDVLVWVILREYSEGSFSYTPFKIWGCGNIAATPVEHVRTDKSTPVPGQSPYDIWYAWQAVLG
jgi:hypothetical protein